MNPGTFPAPFLQKTEQLLGAEESRRLFEALEQEPPVSIRFNPFKLGERPGGRSVPWSRYGYYLAERPRFTLDPLFHGGAYYVQEAGSMFIETLFRQAVDATQPLRILDLCAAPGGKTTLLSTLAGPENIVVANEVIRARAATLSDNVKKWGIGNVLVTNNDPSHFAQLEHYFDVVLVDAPCSGEGMFRKNEKARAEWSEANVTLCAARQQRILSDIWGSLRPGGILIYSTCTFNRTENEENIAWLAEHYACEPVAIFTDPAWGIVQGEVNGIGTFRLYPHRVEGEGFFAAVLRKADGRIKGKPLRPRKGLLNDLPRKDRERVGEWFNQPEYMRHAQIGENIYTYYTAAFPTVAALAGNLNVIYSGILAGQLFGSKFKPEHPLALFHDVARDRVPVVELEPEQALHYLRKNDPDPGLFAEGINMVAYNGLPLGWIKRIGGRVNNMYPKELRILNL